jgi:hypothetical protein
MTDAKVTVDDQEHWVSLAMCHLWFRPVSQDDIKDAIRATLTEHAALVAFRRRASAIMDSSGDSWPLFIARIEQAIHLVNDLANEEREK